MSKFIPGVVVGVVLASVAFLILNRSSHDAGPAPEDSKSFETDVNTESRSLLADRGEMQPDAGEEKLPVETVNQSNDPRNDAGENGQPNEAVADADLPPPVLSISLPRELEYLRDIKNFVALRLRSSLKPGLDQPRSLELTIKGFTMTRLRTSSIVA